MPEIKCHDCGKIFNRPRCHIERNVTKRFFCSHECSIRGRKPPPTICKNCGKSFISAYGRLKTQIFCCYLCYNAYKFGPRVEGTAASHLDRDGYRFIMVGGKNVREHRHVVEQHIGRKLADTETVHHLDGNRTNNRISNLVIMQRSEHSGLHHQPGWDIETVKTLRLEGLTYKQIGEKLGVNGHSIYCTLRNKGLLDELQGAGIRRGEYARR